MGLVLSSPTAVSSASEHSNGPTHPVQTSSLSSPELQASPETDPDSSATASDAVVTTGEKLMRIMTSFMNPATVLDALPDDPLARQVHGISADGSLSSDSSVRSSVRVAPSPEYESPNTRPPQEEQCEQYAAQGVVHIERNHAPENADSNRNHGPHVTTDLPPLTDPLDVLMTRVAPERLVRMLSSPSSNTPSMQSEPTLHSIEVTPSLENV